MTGVLYEDRVPIHSQPPDRLEWRLFDALLKLYRLSWAAGETGRCYVFRHTSITTDEVVIGFLRTETPPPLAAVKALAPDTDIFELNDDQVMELFKQA